MAPRTLSPPLASSARVSRVSAEIRGGRTSLRRASASMITEAHSKSAVPRGAQTSSATDSRAPSRTRCRALGVLATSMGGRTRPSGPWTQRRPWARETTARGAAPPIHPADPYALVTYNQAPAFFDALRVSGDNLYLYAPDAALWDMVGWNSLHPEGTSVCRVPSANGTHQGFDDATSTNAGWQFGCAPSRPTVTILPSQTGRVALGETGRFIMLF